MVLGCGGGSDRDGRYGGGLCHCHHTEDGVNGGSVILRLLKLVMTLVKASVFYDRYHIGGPDLAAFRTGILKLLLFLQLLLASTLLLLLLLLQVS